jgi:hypothetical protein
MSAEKASMVGNDESRELRELIRKHKVCWEVWPEYHIDREGKKIQIGFELDLIGTHYQPRHTPEPGCAECVKVYDDLKRIAYWIMPKEERDSWYEVGVFDASIHYSAQRRFRGEITLPIKILHREGFNRPTDACEVRCLNEMEEKLQALGAHRGSWPESAKEVQSYVALGTTEP